MGLFSVSADDWAALAATLGLRPFAPSARYGPGSSFRQLKRALGVPAPPPPSYQHWLYGTCEGTEVLVLTYETGSGSSTTTWTGALARIDPPILLGLGIAAHGLLDKLFGTTDISVGESTIDERLRITGFDPGRVRALLDPREQGGYGLLADLMRLSHSRTLSVTDSVVALSEQGTRTDIGPTQADLREAVAVARALAARRAALPKTASELAVQGEWRRFADTRALSFDAARMRVSGLSLASVLEIALETEGQQVKTAVTVRFPRPVDVAFTAIRTMAPAFLQGLFSQDIVVGREPFDTMFKVTGTPEGAVRAALARPRLLAAMEHLAAHATEVQLNHQELFFRVDGACVREGDLARLADVGCEVTTELFGALTAVGPYR